MFRVLIKLAIAALVIHAAWRVGSTFWRYYQFEDALQELAQFSESRTDKQLCDQAMEKAANLGVPIAADDLTIRRGANPVFNCERGFQGGVPPARGGVGPAKIFIDGVYTDQLQILPGYQRAWEFKPSANAWVRP
jgi:hypothetical protein